MVQSEFCGRVKPAKIADGRKDDDKLNSEEALLGAVLWLTAIRFDLAADVWRLASYIIV